jgi:hypothetical protein
MGRHRQRAGSPQPALSITLGENASILILSRFHMSKDVTTSPKGARSGMLWRLALTCEVLDEAISSSQYSATSISSEIEG